jgi:EAL domain-containing protein (putative c-di-GMP-specific phosphodiesterase class I)
MRVEAALRRALSNGGLRLVFQPQYPIGQRVPCGAEALLRWNDPELGVVEPTELVVVAEACGLIASIGTWGLEHAIAAAAAWRAAGWTSARVAVNVSAREFTQGDLVALVLGWLERYRLPGDALEIEVTESSLLDGPAALEATLAHLRQAGVTIAIDDFGNGYPSLAHLQRLRVDRLKIDRSFVDKIDRSENECRLCAAIIAMSHHLGLGVVAEGVENDFQHAMLSRMGCDVYQAYWQSGHPVPAEEILERFLAERGGFEPPRGC